MKAYLDHIYNYLNRVTTIFLSLIEILLVVIFPRGQYYFDTRLLLVFIREFEINLYILNLEL